jgi:hypothetical protein
MSKSLVVGSVIYCTWLGLRSSSDAVSDMENVLPRMSTGGSDSVTSPAGIALVLIEVQVTFDSEVKAELFVNH